MTAGGRQLSKAVRLIAQREIPAYAGMTWAGAGMTEPLWRVLSNDREIPACAGMTWAGAGMTGLGENDGETNLLRPGRNPCRKSKR